MKNLSRRVLKGVFDLSPVAVAVIEARNVENGVIAANRAFADLCGCAHREVSGKHLFKPVSESDLAVAEAALSDAVHKKTDTEVVVRDTSQENMIRVSLVPLKDTRGGVSHFYAFFHPDPTPPPESDTEPTELVTEKSMDASSTEQAWELLDRLCRLARRDHRRLSVFVIEMDYFSEFTTAFGLPAVRSSLKRLSTVLRACFRRPGDLVFESENNRWIASTLDADTSQSMAFAESVIQRVRDLYLHHPKSPVAKHVTVSVGLHCVEKMEEVDTHGLVNQATDALKLARDNGGDSVKST